MTRVLLVAPTAAPGGAERTLAALARQLPSHGLQAEAFLLRHGPLEKWLADAGCQARVLPAGRLRDAGSTVRTIGGIRRAIATLRPDVVLSNHSKGHVYGGLAALAAGAPSVWWQHGIPQRCPIEMAAAAVPSAAVVCGSPAAAAAQRRLPPRRPVVTIHPGVPVEEIALRRGSGAAVRRALGWEGRLVVGTVGRLQRGKGQEVFLRAAALTARECPDARFLVVGGPVLGWEGDYPEGLRALAAGLRIEDAVHFAGHQRDVYPWIDALDVAVQPCAGESFGLAVVEAMALGKPVVAAAAGGHLETVEDAVSGLLVPPGDPGATSAAVLEVLRRPALAASLRPGAGLRARAFSAEAMGDAYARLLRGVASGRAVGSESGGMP